MRTTTALLLVCTGALIGCGGGDRTPSIATQLLPPSEVRGFEPERRFDSDHPIDLVAQGLVTLPESTQPSQAVAVFEDAGFEAGAGMGFAAEDGHAVVGVVQLGSGDDARKVLRYVRQEALKPQSFAVCSLNTREFTVTGIPGAEGVALTPQLDPPPDAPPPFVSYGIAFTIGPRLYLVTVAGEPGRVEMSQAVGAAEALYERASPPYAL